MSDITIPPEALEGAKTAFKEATNGYGTFDDFIAATCLGLLKAWPGMVLHPGTHISPACVWLPVADGGTVWVTQEKPNDKA